MTTVKDNLPQISAVLGIIAILLGGLFWIFQVSATATEALKIATEARAKAELKADVDDIQRLDQDVRDLRKSLEESELIDRKKP